MLLYIQYKVCNYLMSKLVTVFLAEMMISGGCYQQSSCYSSRFKLDSLTGTSQIWKYQTSLFFVPIQILSGHMNLELDDPKTKKKSWVYLIFHVNLVKEKHFLSVLGVIWFLFLE